MLAALLGTTLVAGFAAAFVDHRLVTSLGIMAGFSVVLIMAEPDPLHPRPAEGRMPSSRFLVAGWVSILLLSETRLLTRGAGRDPGSVIRGDISIDIALELAATGVVGLVLVAMLFRGWPTRIPPLVGGFLAFALFALASTTWATIPTVTLVRSAQLFVLVLLCAATAGVATVDRSAARAVLVHVHRWFVLAASTLAIYALAFGNQGRLTIPGSHPIAAAGIFGVALLAVACTSDRRELTRPLPWPLIATLLAFAVLETRSRGPLAAVVIALVAYAFQRGRANARVAAVLSSGGGATVLAALVFAGGALTTYLLRGQTAEQFSALTGRRRLWSYILDNPAGSEVWGLGYAGNRTVLLQEFHWAGHAHNSWMDLLQTLGVLGVGLMAAANLALIVQGLRWDSTPTLTFATFAIVMSLTDDAFAQPALSMGTLLLATAWLYADGRAPGRPSSGRSPLLIGRPSEIP